MPSLSYVGIIAHMWHTDIHVIKNTYMHKFLKVLEPCLLLAYSEHLLSETFRVTINPGVYTELKHISQSISPHDV